MHCFFLFFFLHHLFCLSGSAPDTCGKVVTTALCIKAEEVAHTSEHVTKQKFVALMLKMHTPPLQKHPKSTPTFQIPIRPSKRLPRREFELLRKNSPEVTTTWSEDEIKALVEAVLLNCRGETMEEKIFGIPKI